MFSRAEPTRYLGKVGAGGVRWRLVVSGCVDPVPAQVSTRALRTLEVRCSVPSLHTISSLAARPQQMPAWRPPFPCVYLVGARRKRAPSSTFPRPLPLHSLDLPLLARETNIPRAAAQIFPQPQPLHRDVRENLPLL